ncbi:hypothetical protein [Haloferula sp.]|uniref:hypothetical protein n=1 Tax=Haloferula sp. TaxID=2497595 RepID=UPI003C7963CD
MFLLFTLSVVLLIPAILWATVLDHREDLYLSGVFLGIAIPSGLIYLMVGSGIRCPLCHGPLIANPRCSRNRKASRLLGSYRLAVTSRVLLFGRFRCPCCGEPCICDARR